MARRGLWIGMLLAAMLAAAGPALAQDVLLRSDLPLWTEEDDNVWPHSFADSDGMGCVYLLPAGIWDRVDAERPDEETRVRIRNQGIFHCVLGVSIADESPPEWGAEERALLIDLGKAPGPKGDLTLYALQGGFRGGSSYVLLAAEPPKGKLTRLLVLGPECPDAWVRESRKPTVWVTEYCAVPDEAGLRRIARAAAAKAPTGTLDYIGPEPGEP